MGWLVDGAVFTLQLMPYKCVDFSKLIKNLCKQSYCPLLKFQELAGKLQHSSFVIPGGKGLFSTIHEALKITSKSVNLTPYFKTTLWYWINLFQHLAQHPTPIQFLVSNYPSYIQYTDSCKLGAGGVITLGIEVSKYWVWQYEYPDNKKPS